MLYQAVSSINLKEKLKPIDQYRPFPAYSDRAAWGALDEEVKGYYAGLARGLQGAEIPFLRATRYLDFARDGNRSRYEALYFARRSNLVALVLAECIAGDGELIDDIIDLIWAICEETSWVIPAHNNYYDGPPRALPDIEAPYAIDLFAAETGSALAWAHYFLGEAIAERAPLVTCRIEVEVKRRILDRYLDYDGNWWKGLQDDAPVNNWNPWINSNVLTAFLVLERDEKRRIEGVKRTAKSTQRFLDGYFPDGGCDEGPTYFTVAGASLLDYLEELHYATGGAVDLYGEELIQNMAKYIYRAHVAGEYYVNFADAAPRVSIHADQLIRVGASIGDETLQRFAEYLRASGFSQKGYIGDYGLLYRLIGSIFGYTAPAEEALYAAPRDHFFDGIQMMTARQKADSAEGFFTAFKGGHNAESHNHNDVGSFVLYRDGKPIVIDAGVETYTRFTFSDRRYDLWTMRSDHHNLPDINGYTQLPGREFEARDVRYEVSGKITEMSLNIAAAYPREAGVKSYRRTLRFNRDAGAVTVHDEYELIEAIRPLINYFLCFNEPDIGKPGEINLGGVKMTYDASIFDVSVEEIALTDPKIRGDWQTDCLYRVVFTAKSMREKGAFAFAFTGA